MAMQADSPAAVLPSAQVVGNAFVEQYYHILHESPELVYKFYQDVSILSRPDSSGIMSSVTTMKAINETILSLDYKNCKAEINTADAQESYQGGVIVLVTGSLTGIDNVKRKFSQTFFLAPQEKGYFVQNDVFRYVEEFEPSRINGYGEGDAVASLTLDPEPNHVQENHAIDSATTFEAEDLQNGPEVCDPSDNEEGSGLEEEVVDEPPSPSSLNGSSVVVLSEPSVAHEEKKSYASIVRVTKVIKSSAPTHVPTSSLRWTPANTPQQTRAPANTPQQTRAPANTPQQTNNNVKPSPEPEASAPAIDNTPESSNEHEEVEGHSIYVRNLPMNASVTQLEEAFKVFGPIKPNGVQVRSNKTQGFCFGFVEFESLDSMQNAIKAAVPVTIGNRQVVVEEKRTTTRVGSGGRGKYPSGRGGFRNDNFRGRGNYGGGRGYGRNEFRNQGEYSSRPKGPNNGRTGGESYQRVDQNGAGGGRFGRQGGTNKAAAAAASD